MYKHRLTGNSVVIELQGGVGNQLFQFVAALYLANLRNKRLELDFGLISRSTHWGANISRIQILSYSNKSNTDIDIKYSTKIKKIRDKPMSRVRNKLDSILGVAIFQNSKVGFEEKIIKKKHISKMRGYFQSYYYMDELIRKGLLSKSDLLQESKSEEFCKIEKFIREKTPIFVHIRAGDYTRLKDTIGVLAPEYYKNAIQGFPNYRKRHILLFTDNFDYATAIMSAAELDFTFFDETSTMHPMELITLMSYGTDFVISNSTFSWWGAKLSTESGTIIAPTPWFKDRELPSKLIPLNWSTHKSVFLD